jgi:hypothetical protein
MIGYILIAIALGLVVYVFAPYVAQLRLRAKHGRLVSTSFYPLLGLFHFMEQGLRKDKDIISYKRKPLREQPETKVTRNSLII